MFEADDHFVHDYFNYFQYKKKNKTKLARRSEIRFLERGRR